MGWNRSVTVGNVQGLYVRESSRTTEQVIGRDPVEVRLRGYRPSMNFGNIDSSLSW
jgi:hypothetical protein